MAYFGVQYRGDATPALFLRHHPLQYLATLALHGFAIDHQLVVTFQNDGDPRG